VTGRAPVTVDPASSDPTHSDPTHSDPASVDPPHGPDLERCSDRSRARAESPAATAPVTARLLLVEAPGPWGRAGLTASRLSRAVSTQLAAAAEAHGVRVQLIRRPGRHPGPPRPAALPSEGTHAWALAEPAAGAVRWGRWGAETDLLAVDLDAPLDPAVDASTGPQRLVLVCTHARHDVCCAVRGRPVVAALTAAGLDREVWETSHLGGDRFAANVLALPEGEVFGGLDEGSAVAAVRALDGGRLDLDHHRGRVGRTPPEQAAVHLAACSLGVDGTDAVRLLGPVARTARDGTGQHYGARVQVGGRVHRLDLVEWWAAPDRLTCAAVEAKPARRYDLAGIELESLERESAELEEPQASRGV